jgi:hypothetical protein
MKANRNRPACRRLSAMVLALLVLATVSWAVQPRKASASVTGPHKNSADLVLDGKFVPKGSEWDGEGCLSWEGKETFVIVDMGESRRLEGLVIEVDNNDDYTVEVCEEGKKTWVPLLEIKAGYGKVSSGMDIFSSVKGDPDFETRVGFKPVKVRYVRLRATGGDNMYSVAEIKIISKEIPRR